MQKMCGKILKRLSGLVMLKSNYDMRLTAYFDSNWSTFSVYVDLLDDFLVSWETKKLFHNLLSKSNTDLWKIQLVNLNCSNFF